MVIVTSEHSEHEQQPDETPARPVAPAQPATSGDQDQRKKLRGKALRDILLYGFLRLLLFLVLTVIIHSIVILLGMASYFPLLISMTLALLLALPLSMFMFKKLRLRVTAEVAEWDAGRKAHRAQLRDQLRERMDE